MDLAQLEGAVTSVHEIAISFVDAEFGIMAKTWCGGVMSSKRENSLRAYHLLVLRQASGFGWQVRYDRHANAVERSLENFTTHDEAQTNGQEALRRHQEAALKDR